MDQNSLFRFAVDNAIGMIIIFDDSGTILYANKTAGKRLEYYDELINESITEIFPGEFKVNADEVTSSYEMNGELHSMMAYRKNRTCFPVRAKFLIHNEATQLFNTPGQRFDDLPLYGGQRTYVCTAFDMSKEDFLEKKVSNADKEVEAALKVKSEFMARFTSLDHSSLLLYTLTAYSTASSISCAL